MPKTVNRTIQLHTRSRAVARPPLKRLELSENLVTAMAQQLWSMSGPTCSMIHGLPCLPWSQLTDKTRNCWRAVATAALMKGATL